MVLGRTLIIIALITALSPAAPAAAQPPTPPGSATPRPAPTPSPSPAPAPMPRPTTPAPTTPPPGPTASAEATPSPSASPSLSPQQLAAARARLTALSLLDQITLQVERTRAGMLYLEQRILAVRAEQAAIEIALTGLREREQERREAHSRMLQHEFRKSRISTLEVLVGSGSFVAAMRHREDLAAVRSQEQALLAEIRGLTAEQIRSREALSRHEVEVAALLDTITTKERVNARLLERSRRLADTAERGGDISGAELEILRELAAEAAQADQEQDVLLRAITERSGVPLPPLTQFVWPARGVVSQDFGPSDHALQPARTFRGVSYAHFHDGIDIAAPVGTPVVAIAAGQVAFVGHLADGAMVVIVAHEGGLVSLYGHLDDAEHRPVVRVGDHVRAGDPLGAIGLTGITTGPHVHMVVRRGAEPIDPRTILPPRASGR